MITAAALGIVLLGCLIGRRLRAMQPTGTHRAVPRPVSPYPDAEPVAIGWCAECARSTPHALHDDGSRTCFQCNNTNQETV